MKYPNASVIIPTYNREELLKSTLLALSKQNYPKYKYEIIVVDDGNDETNKMIKKLNVSNLRYFKIKKLGCRCVSRARNFGIKKAKNEIIIFVDSDIIVTPNFVLEHVKSHNKDKKLVVIGYTSALETKREHNRKEIMKLVEKNYDKITGINVIPNYIDRMSEECLNNLNELEKPWEIFLTGNASVRRQCLLDVGMFDENFKGWGLEDIELGYRLIKWGLKFKLNRNALGYHIGTDIVLNPFLSPSSEKWNNYIKNMNYFLKKFNNSEVKKTLIELDKRMPNKFRLFKDEENIEKMIQLNNRKLAILFDKEISLLKGSKILKKWYKIEKNILKLEQKRNYEWKKIEPLENSRKEIERKIKLTRKNRVFNDLKGVEEDIRNLEKIRNTEWKKIEPLENRRRKIEKKKIELLKKKRIFNEWKEIGEERDKIEKMMNDKLKAIREPKRIELGEILEKEYLATKGELGEHVHVLRSEIRKYEKELALMWLEKFATIEREIIRLNGRESLLLKSKGLENIWKNLSEEKNEVERKIDEIRGGKFILIEDKIDELRKKRDSVIKNRVFSKLDGLGKERNDIQKKIDKVRSRKLTLIEDKIDELKEKRNSLLMKHSILKKWNELERERENVENKNQLLKIKLKKLELNR